MDSAACFLLLLVAAIGHCDESRYEFFRKTVFLAKVVSDSFGDEMVMEIIDHDQPDGEQMTLTVALTRLLGTAELDKFVADTIGQLKTGYMCKVLKYAALASKLGMRSVESAKVHKTDTQELIVAYTKTMGLTVAETASNLMSQFYEKMAGNVADEMNGKLTAIDAAHKVQPNHVIKEGARGSIHSSVVAAAEQAAAEISQRISNIFNREDGNLAEALKQYAELKNANIGNYNKKIDELIAHIGSKNKGENDESALHQYTAETMPVVTTEIAMKSSSDVYGTTAERTLQHMKNVLEFPNPYLSEEDRTQTKVFLDELEAAIPTAVADPDAAHAVLSKLFEWSSGKIKTDCASTTDNEALYGTLVGSDIVKDAFSDNQLTANWLLDKQVTVVDKLKTEQDILPDIWKAAA